MRPQNKTIGGAFVFSNSVIAMSDHTSGRALKQQCLKSYYRLTSIIEISLTKVDNGTKLLYADSSKMKPG